MNPSAGMGCRGPRTIGRAAFMMSQGTRGADRQDIVVRPGAVAQLAVFEGDVRVRWRAKVR